MTAIAATPVSECFGWLASHAASSGVEHYFNSGVILFNITEWHKNDLNQKLQELTPRFKDDFFLDQHVLNILFNHKKIMMPMKYNLTSGCETDDTLLDPDLREANEHPIIIHYTISKPLQSQDHKFYYLWKEVFDKVTKLNEQIQ